MLETDLPGTGQSPLIVALDYPEPDAALAMARRLDPRLVRVKVGKQLFTRAGPALVTQLQSLGFGVFLDLKFHDIPNTVAGAVAAAAELGVWMVNVHASGGARMMRAARDALTHYQHPPLLVAVTVLTSMGPEDLAELGITRSPADCVRHLAQLTATCGLDGVVCSAEEAGLLSECTPPEFLRVTPGIRLPGDDADDQRRVVSPRNAIDAGASHLVMGRSITGARDPAQVVDSVLASIAIG
ncbi:orotidine 5'-phosphate decarboxylase [Luminiphilus syltensis NOR5-1B]|uniref:Orotidine 5'-phosphate decarboxylase n=1 Tax=Luminiphilus syltensis NOR5-1B TaxID=565045 RepID=B8KX35_9GAMM|nr:orotidine-5'-phosphate decarboxylase [Luminiphilus syltensis]EED34721.1 orotidine 5'-phosphate decarboxylase [Luminiphilus syltensis NOR5-1B]